LTPPKMKTFFFLMILRAIYLTCAPTSASGVPPSKYKSGMWTAVLSWEYFTAFFKPYSWYVFPTLVGHIWRFLYATAAACLNPTDFLPRPPPGFRRQLISVPFMASSTWSSSLPLLDPSQGHYPQFVDTMSYRFGLLFDVHLLSYLLHKRFYEGLI